MCAALGVGCAIHDNYVDLRFRNDTDVTFQLRVRVGERYLEGQIRTDRQIPCSYSVYAQNERFVCHQGDWFRRNEIWRDVIDRRTGNTIRAELVRTNCALVKYIPPSATATDSTDTLALGEAPHEPLAH